MLPSGDLGGDGRAGAGAGAAATVDDEELCSNSSSGGTCNCESGGGNWTSRFSRQTIH